MRDASEDQIDLRALGAVLRRQYRLAALTLALTLGMALVYLFQATPLYTASSLVLVDPRAKNILEDSDGQGGSTSSENARLESEVVILKSPKVLLQTIQNAGLLGDPEFGPRVGLFDKIKLALGIQLSQGGDNGRILAGVMGRLSQAVTVRRQGATYVLNVSVTSQSPARAARIANALVETYIDLQVQSKVDLALGSRDLLQSQLEASRQSLAASEDNLDKFIGANIDQIRAETGDADLGQLSDQVAALEDRRLNGERVQAELGRALQASDWQVLADALQNDALAQLQKERSAIAERLAGTAPDDTAAQDLTAQLQKIEADLEKTATQALSSVQSEVSALAGQGSDLRRALRTKVLSSDLSARTLTALYELQQEADIAQRQYATLISRMRDLEAQAVVQLADSRVVSEALAPNSPTSPNTRLVLAAAVLAGLGLGLGLAFLNEYYLGGVTSGSQLANLLPVPVAAIIPMAQVLRENASVSDNIPQQPLSGFAEAFRKLRAAIDLTWMSGGGQSGAGQSGGRARAARDGTAADRRTGQSKGCHVIMVASAVPGEGKSSIALSLARTYALSGKTVMLIDADLRKPSLHKNVNLPARTGFLEYLSGGEESIADADYIVKDPLTPASLVLGGGRPTQATDQLLQSENFTQLIQLLREQMDVIIIDTSPLVPVVDARYIAPLVDTALLAVRYGATSQSDLRYAYEQLAQSLNKNAACYSVLSIDEHKNNSYKYSGYYSSYTSD